MTTTQHDAQVAALVALAEHGIPPDVQELLVHGDGRGTVAPGALAKMIAAIVGKSHNQERTTTQHDAQVEAVARAITEADAGFGYSFNLTRLVDGEQTHTLSMPGFDPIDFIEDREEGYQLIEQRRNLVRARAVIAALSTAAVPPQVPDAGEEVLRSAHDQLEKAARDYAINYMQDEAADEEDCVCGRKQHLQAVAVFEALDEVARARAALATQERG